MNDFFLALGGGNEIGASCYLLHLGGANILIDAGMRLNAALAFPDFGLLSTVIGGLDRLDVLLLTHAHLDHSGALTRIQYEVPRLRKYTTGPTRDLIEIMLSDAIRVSAKQQSEDWFIVEKTEELLQDVIESLELISFRESVDIGKNNCKATAIPAGHILGAASYLIEIDGRRILHTGDISLHSQRTIAGMDIEQISDIDLLIIESTYAFQPNYHQETVEEQYYTLASMVSQVIDRGGRALIPAFALGRAQEIATLFSDLFEQGVLQPFDVYLDGLVKPICEVYNQNREFLQGRQRSKIGHVIYNQYVKPMPNEFYPTPAAVNQLQPSCIISSSGMLLDHTRSAAYAQEILTHSSDAVIFSGYLDDESPGRRLLSLQAGETVRINGKRIARKADVSSYHLSAHAPSRDLSAIIETVNPRQVILVHGDYQFTGDTQFLEFLLTLDRRGINVHQAANRIPIYL